MAKIPRLSCGLCLIWEEIADSGWLLRLLQGPKYWSLEELQRPWMGKGKKCNWYIQW